MSDQSRVRVDVAIAATQFSQEQLEERTLTLIAEIKDAIPGAQLELGTHGSAPEGARSGTVLDVGAFAIVLAPVILDQAITIIRSWVSRNAKSSQKVEVTVLHSASLNSWSVSTQDLEPQMQVVVTMASTEDS